MKLPYISGGNLLRSVCWSSIPNLYIVEKLTRLASILIKCFRLPERKIKRKGKNVLASPFRIQKEMLEEKKKHVSDF